MNTNVNQINQSAPAVAFYAPQHNQPQHTANCSYVYTQAAAPVAVAAQPQQQQQQQQSTSQVQQNSQNQLPPYPHRQQVPVQAQQQYVHQPYALPQQQQQVSPPQVVNSTTPATGESAEAPLTNAALAERMTSFFFGQTNTPPQQSPTEALGADSPAKVVVSINTDDEAQMATVTEKPFIPLTSCEQADRTPILSFDYSIERGTLVPFHHAAPTAGTEDASNCPAGTTEGVSPYLSATIPPVPVPQYVVHALDFCRAPTNCGVLTLILMMRLTHRGPRAPTAEEDKKVVRMHLNALVTGTEADLIAPLSLWTFHRLFFSCFLLSCKFLEDRTYRMAYYTSVGGFPTSQELSGLEAETFRRLGYSLWPTEEEWAFANNALGLTLPMVDYNPTSITKGTQAQPVPTTFVPVLQESSSSGSDGTGSSDNDDSSSVSCAVDGHGIQPAGRAGKTVPRWSSEDEVDSCNTDSEHDDHHHHDHHHTRQGGVALFGCSAPMHDEDDDDKHDEAEEAWLNRGVTTSSAPTTC